MWSHSARWESAIRAPHVLLTTCTHRNLVNGVTTRLDIVDGGVVEDVNSEIRRQLALSIPAKQATWDLLDTPGGEITVMQGIRYVDGTRELIPQGVFVVDRDEIGYGRDDTITMTCPDRWVKVQRNRFGLSRVSVPGNAAYQEIQRLVEACWGGSYPFPGWSTLSTTATTKVGSVLWDDGERATAITKLAADNSHEVYFDRQGKAVLRPVPTINLLTPSVWLVDASQRGVMIGAARTRDRSTTRNAVVVTSSATDVKVSREKKNTTAGDPLNTTGPLGYVPFYYDSPTIRTNAQADAAALTILRKKLGVAKQLTLEAVGNPALDAEDVVTAVLPKTEAGLPRPVEIHMLDAVTHPFKPDGTQEIQTRSTRPDTDGT